MLELSNQELRILTSLVHERHSSMIKGVSDTGKDIHKDDVSQAQLNRSRALFDKVRFAEFNSRG